MNTTIAILGRPNVGKSTLFNRLLGQRKSIVAPIEGVTRDRIYAKVEWLDKEFNLIDNKGKRYKVAYHFRNTNCIKTSLKQKLVMYDHVSLT